MSAVVWTGANEVSPKRNSKGNDTKEKWKKDSSVSSRSLTGGFKQSKARGQKSRTRFRPFMREKIIIIIVTIIVNSDGAAIFGKGSGCGGGAISGNNNISRERFLGLEASPAIKMAVSVRGGGGGQFLLFSFRETKSHRFPPPLPPQSTISHFGRPHKFLCPPCLPPPPFPTYVRCGFLRLK